MPGDFDGTTSLVNCGSENGVANIEMQGATSGMTISAWIFPRGYGENGLGRIYAKGNQITGTSGFFDFRVDNVNVSSGMSVVKDHVTTDLVAGSTNQTILLNSMQHVVFVWTGTSQFTSCSFYKNAVLLSSAVGQSAAGAKQSDTLQSIVIGNVSDASRTFDGTISELAVWSAILTQHEISLLGRSDVRGIPLQVRPGDLRGYWPMDDWAEDSTATVNAKDRSTNGNDGTPTAVTGRAESVLSNP